MQDFTITGLVQRKPSFILKIHIVNGLKYRLRALGQGVCLKSMLRTITMQGLIFSAITGAGKTKLT